MWKSRWRQYFTKQGLRHLLINTDFTMGQIARMTGYTTSSRFAELFKKSTGILPIEYRKIARREQKQNIFCNKIFFREETRL